MYRDKWSLNFIPLFFRQSAGRVTVSESAGGVSVSESAGGAESAGGIAVSESGSQGKNFLISQDDGSDSEEEREKQESKGDQSKTVEKLPNPMAGRLPKPAIGKKKKRVKTKINVEGSVFVNPFEKAEQAKQSILEKHVKMVENQHVTGKKVKICFKFRKGRCPFGKNCKYSHDVDSNLALPYQSEESAEASDEPNSGKNQNRQFQNVPPPPKPMGFMGTIGTLNAGPRKGQTTSRRSYSQYRQQLQDKEAEADDDNYMSSMKKKKRCGVAQSLVPPKKAMSALTKQRTEERPWTVQEKESS